MTGPSVSKRPSLLMSLLYQKFAVDELGAPIFLGTFNQLQGPLPIRASFIVSNQYTNGFGMHRQHTVVTDPDEQIVIQSEETSFYLQDAISGHRVDERFITEFKKDGRHRVRVVLDGEIAIDYYFIVRNRPQPAGTQAVGDRG